MEYKHYCVIDAQGGYKTFVLTVDGRVRHYALGAGERLLDAPAPAARPYAGAEGFIAPRWNGTAWAEGASEAEAAAWEAEHPAPEERRADSAGADLDAMLVDHEYRLTLLELGLEEGG